MFVFNSQKLIDRPVSEEMVLYPVLKCGLSMITFFDISHSATSANCFIILLARNLQAIFKSDLVHFLI
jgi:hypothetical protein